MKKFFKWLFSLFYWGKKHPPIESSSFDLELYSLEIVSELPNEIDDKIVYLEGDKNKNDFWYAMLNCPCGCQEKIMLNLMNDVKPYWEITIKGSSFSISPSIWRTKNCESHFWLKNSKVIWV